MGFELIFFKIISYYTMYNSFKMIDCFGITLPTEEVKELLDQNM